MIIKMEATEQDIKGSVVNSLLEATSHFIRLYIVLCCITEIIS